jgi:glutamine amidotransferase
MRTSVAVVDYGMCNIDSVVRALEECGAAAFVAREPAELARADRIVLPGVGSFRDAMVQLRARDLPAALDREVRELGAPFLGICLGMQLLATTGTEGGACDGLGWFPAAVERLAPTEQHAERIPHVGWNEVDPVGDQPLFRSIAPGTDFYFVHSYHVHCEPGDAAATTPYCGGFTSALHADNIHAVQFHPEKSQHAGLALLRNFLEL